MVLALHGWFEWQRGSAEQIAGVCQTLATG
jgi:hypothetical protein